MTDRARSLISVKGLSVVQESREHGRVCIVEDASLELRAGETLGIVGESGSGKSLLSKGIGRIVPPSLRVEAEIINIDGEDLLNMSARELTKRRPRLFSMILQDPLSSLNPSMKVGPQICEALLHTVDSKAGRRSRALELLSLVGISDPEVKYRSYPHRLSGGMRQRVVGAIAQIGRAHV